MSVYAPNGYTLPDPKRRFNTRNFEDAWSQKGAESLVILAKTPEELYTALAQANDFSALVITPVLNLLPSSSLMKVISLLQTRSVYENDNRNPRILQLAQMVATRAWLTRNQELLTQAALLIDKYTSGGDKALLNAIQQDDTERLRYILGHPSMRPMVAYRYGSWDDIVRSSGETDESGIYRTGSSGWWCQYRPDQNRAALDMAWSLVPSTTANTALPVVPPQFADARAKAIAAHPLMKLVDNQEQAQIQAVPQAPELLTKKVLALKRSESLWFWQSGDQRLPEMLHLAVRTTRYGCSRDGSHQSYSFDAFRTLNKSYPNSIWTKATPYWFE